MADIKLSLSEVADLTQNALIAAGANAQNAASVARSTVKAERDGIRSHGLLYVPIYADHVKCGKVDGTAEPVVETTRPGAIQVDAKTGFAHPAIDAGWQSMTNAARQNGVSAMTIHNSYNCGVLGHHAERLAEDGLLGLCFTHAPASIAPIGGNRPVIGTNPFSIAAPDGNSGAAILIDQSASIIAKSEILQRSKTSEPIEPEWAFDAAGNPTTDAAEALKGTMAPSGGYKGVGIGLLVEIMAACLSGAVLSKDASPFGGTAGGPPKTGQCFMAFDPSAFAGSGFAENIAALTAAISDQEGARLPGDRRKSARARIQRDGLLADQDLVARIRKIAES